MKRQVMMMVLALAVGANAFSAEAGRRRGQTEKSATEVARDKEAKKAAEEATGGKEGSAAIAEKRAERGAKSTVKETDSQKRLKEAAAKRGLEGYVAVAKILKEVVDRGADDADFNKAVAGLERAIIDARSEGLEGAEMQNLKNLGDPAKAALEAAVASGLDLVKDATQIERLVVAAVKEQARKSGVDEKKLIDGCKG